MRAILIESDRLLRGRLADEATTTLRSITMLLTIIVLGGMLYGAVMGSFGGFTAERLWQVIYSAVKVPLFVLATFAISVPSFFVFGSLLGLRADFHRAIRALIATQAALAIVLCSLAPFTALWYRTSGVYRSAVAINGAMFAVASIAAQVVAWRHYRALIATNPRYRWLLLSWVTIYVFVGIQMAWALRPFIGDPDIPPEWFRQGAWSNAYVRVIRLVWRVFTM